MYQIVLIMIITVGVFFCTLGLMFSVKFQQKQKKKYSNCVKLIKEKENTTVGVSNGLSKEDIALIDKDVDVDNLMSSLYDSYIELINRINNLDSNLKDLLTHNMSELYTSKIASMQEKNTKHVIDGIDLMGYSIIEFEKEKLKFRVSINCFDYKLKNEEIISGSNLEKLSQINIITFEKIDDKWLISNIEKAFEQKLSN